MSDAAREMTPEGLAEIRAHVVRWVQQREGLEGPGSSMPLAEQVSSELLSHVDALTADRDEARSEVRALREQRDEARSAFLSLFEAVTMWQTVDGAPDVSDDEEADARDALVEAADKANDTWRTWRCEKLAALAEARALDEWSEDVGDVLWWRFPIEEPPYCGSPICDDWPGYHTHWTPIEVPEEPARGPS